MTTTTMTPQASLVFWWAECPKHQLHHDIFVVLVFPTRLRHRRRRCHPPKMRRRHLILHRDAVAVVALPILQPNEPR